MTDATETETERLHRYKAALQEISEGYSYDSNSHVTAAEALADPTPPAADASAAETVRQQRLARWQAVR